MEVPDVLLSGDHRRIAEWRQKKALQKTLRNRPDLLAGAPLSAEQMRWLQEFREEKENEPSR